MAMIEFRTLGTLDLRNPEGHQLHSLLAQPKRLALLAYLCVANNHGFHRRDTLLGLFWPESDESHARTSLRNALHVLRHSLGETALNSRGDEEVGVNAQLVWCDATTFAEALAADCLDEALALYRGEFLDGFFVEDVPAFEQWVESERQKLRGSAARAARIAAERLEQDRNVTDAIKLARRAVQLTDPDERAVRRLVELLVRAGDRAGALQAYESFAQQMVTEFGAEPSPDTRALVEGLRLDHHASRSSHPLQAAKQTYEDPSRPTVPGYAIEKELGRGGTSIVFLAHDLKHNRRVALKILRPEVAALVGTDRFLSEIGIAARLNHPNILPLLDSGKANDLPYYAMPGVEGETLRTRLRREKFLPLDQAIRITCAIADALEYAHTHGIIHRDIKPENILLENGRALVTDFGIARALREAGGQRLTETGLAVGTAAYMSPEQADNALEVDARADLYALGCVLYEMLAGDPPFPGSTAQAVLSRKAAEPAPPLRTVRETVPIHLERNVLKALARSPADRFGSVREFADALVSPTPVPSPETHNAKTGVRRAAAGVLLSLLIVIVALALARTISAKKPNPPQVRRKLTTSGDAMMASLSPDGQFLGYVTHAGDSERVVVQDLAGGAANTVMTTEPVVWSLEWSRDGTRLLVGGMPRAVVLPRFGGTETKLGPKVGGQVMAYWLPDSLRFSVHDAGDRRVLVFDPRTQDSVTLPVKGEYTWLMEGSWSPSGHVFALMTQTGDPVSWAIRTVSLNGRNTELVADSVLLGSPRWSQDGSELYYARGTDALWRIPVSPSTGEARGPPREVINDLEMFTQRFGLVHFALTSNGRAMLYAKGSRFSNLWLVERRKAESQPRTTALTTGTFLRWSPVVAPDANSIAFAQQVEGGAEVFVIPINGGTPTQITSGARIRAESQIAWSPDGTRIAFSTIRRSHAQVWVVNLADGRMRAFEQTRMSTATGHLTWAPGAKIAYQAPNHQSVNLIDPNSGAETVAIRDSAMGAIHSPTYSPDGKRIAAFWFRGNAPKPTGIYIFDLAHSTSRGLMGGIYPRGWSPDGRYLYYQWPQSPIIYRLNANGTKQGEIFLRPPFREAQCVPIGISRPDAFLCAAFDFASDIWRIDNFDPGGT